MEKIKVRGLFCIAAWIFNGVGFAVFVLGLFHAFLGEPEANYYSPQKWDFVTQEQWLRWSGFEVSYGLACLGLGYLLLRYANRVPDWVEREKSESQDPFL